MKRLLLFCLLIFAYFQTQAQKYPISLANVKFGRALYNLEVTKVIDLRPDTTNIGWIGKGMGNQKIHGDLPGKLPAELHAFFNKNLVSGKDPIKLIVKVNKFHLTERRFGDWELGTAEVALEFLMEKKDGSGYCKILNTGSSNEIANFNDVTAKHGANLAAVLEDCFKQVSQLYFLEVCNKTPAVSADYLQLNTYYNFDPESIPILAAAKPQKGFYRNFQEFKRNQPGLVEEITQKNNGDFVYTETGKKVTDIWGYSDGDRTFIYYGAEGSYFPMKKKGDHFTFVVKYSTTDNGAIIMGALIGGIPGAALAGALSEDSHLVEVSLNPLTGHKTTGKGFGPKADLERAGKIILYRNNKNESSDPISFYVNDSLYAQILPNTVNEFAFKAPLSELNLCLKNKDKTCQKVRPILDRTEYFECSMPVKPNAKLVFKQATQKEADYYVKIIKHNQDKGKM